MKKYFSYILILIILTGLFAPLIKVSAQSNWVNGDCWKGGVKIMKLPFDTPREGITYEMLCTGELYKGKWQAQGTPPPPEPDGPKTTPTGACFYFVNNAKANFPEDNCKNGPKTYWNGSELTSQTYWSATGLPIPVTPPTTPPTQPPTKKEVDPNYTLLTPLPCDKDRTAGCDENNKLTKYDPSQGTTQIGNYLNTMIRIFIGLCAVLAMIMIIMGGLEYMTSELISSKESGKQKITDAVLGLLLALSSWAILNTINPKLLETDVGSLTEVKVLIEIEGESLSDAITSDSGTPPAGPTAICKEGIQKTTSGIFACGGIAKKVDDMVAAAKAAGIIIGGGGYRTPERQTKLREQNCKGNTTDRAFKCSPPTALPGESRHNNGLAFDLTCDGSTIKDRTNKCFVWLKANAGSFELYNLSSEPWHWSTDGR